MKIETNVVKIHSMINRFKAFSVFKLVIYYLHFNLIAM